MFMKYFYIDEILGFLKRFDVIYHFNKYIPVEISFNGQDNWLVKQPVR